MRKVRKLMCLKPPMAHKGVLDCGYDCNVDVDVSFDFGSSSCYDSFLACILDIYMA
jgi:hypothetical protein